MHMSVSVLLILNLSDNYIMHVDKHFTLYIQYRLVQEGRRPSGNAPDSCARVSSSTPDSPRSAADYYLRVGCQIGYYILGCGLSAGRLYRE